MSNREHFKKEIQKKTKEPDVNEIDRNDYQDFLNGDITSFERLVLRHKDALIYFIHRFVKNLSTAEDIAQDVFVDIYVYKERFKLNSNFKTYIYTIARNKAVDYIRKNNRMVFVEEYHVVESQEEELEERVIRQEEKKQLYSALKELKKEYQAAITLIDLEEMSYAQAAHILGKTEVQMKVLIHRARKSLAKKFSAHLQ